ncbi:Fe2+-enterobactin ABC transporter substrate-binding protein [Paenarthrobacter sp. NPDC089989]|uniref:Fe2+-enterobactin ABC transporter substrate-binding protein n=1 Tax=unclassified Paenarthrobacter TaxID=2634190 RepID=UPI00381EEBDA
MKFRLKVIPAAAALAAAALALAGCSGTSTSAQQSPSSEASAASSSWPRTVKHENGETVINAKPENIVSTSITATGSLLAINAPVKKTAATNPSDITDSKGFFSQWASVADERGVGVLYPNLELDLEAVIASDPDLIVVSTSGADSVADHYKELSDIAPTIVVNYADKTWQDLATELGEATGHEDDAKSAISEFDGTVKAAADKIKHPSGNSTIMNFNGAGNDSAVGKLTGTHAKLLTQLGFKVTEAPEGLDSSKTPRSDFAFVSLENLPKAATAENLFVLSGEEAEVKAILDEPVLANLPAVKAKTVHPLGKTSFRLDYYSGKQLVDLLTNTFS